MGERLNQHNSLIISLNLSPFDSRVVRAEYLDETLTVFSEVLAPI